MWSSYKGVCAPNAWWAADRMEYILAKAEKKHIRQGRKKTYLTRVMENILDKANGKNIWDGAMENIIDKGDRIHSV